MWPSLIIAICFLCGALGKQNVPKPDGQVNVTASFVVTTANFDEATRTLSGMVWLSVHWKDERLAWDSASGPWSKHVSPDEIWIPDLTFFHSPFQTEPADAIVYPDGSVYWVPKVFFSETCVQSSVRFFPYDSYVCRLAFGSWTYGFSELNLFLNENAFDVSILEPLQENSVWEISVKDVTLFQKIYKSHSTETYPKALYDFELKRKSSSLGVIVIFPAIMLAFMTVAMFLIPSESREKVTFGAIIFLAIILIMKDLPAVLPNGGVTAISCYYAVNLTFVTGALFLHCCLVLMSYPVNSSVRPSPSLRRFASALSKFSCLATEQLDLDDADSDDSELSNSAKGARNIAEWRFVARMLDRLFLIIFTLLLLIFGLLSTVMAEEKLVVPNV